MQNMGKACIPGAGVFAGATITAYSIGRDPALLVIGVTLIILAGMSTATLMIIGAIGKANRETSAAFDLGRDIGHDQGYLEGRRVAKPVLVQLPQHGCGCSSATGSEG